MAYREERSAPDPAAGLNPKVVEVYTKCVHLLCLISLVEQHAL